MPYVQGTRQESFKAPRVGSGDPESEEMGAPNETGRIRLTVRNRNQQVDLRTAGPVFPVSFLPRMGLVSQSGMHFPSRWSWSGPAPKAGKQGPESRWKMVPSSRATAPFHCAPSLATANPTHVTPIPLHQEEGQFPQKLPDLQELSIKVHMLAKEAAVCILCFHPPPASIMKQPRCPWMTARRRGASHWAAVWASLFSN